MWSKRTYDPQLRKTDHGRRLYEYWRTVHRGTDSIEFETFPGFYEWSMQNGYTIGARLFRYDPDEPFNPDNCFWEPTKGKIVNQKYVCRDFPREKQWDDVVNRIRQHYGMEPIFSSDTIPEV